MTIKDLTYFLKKVLLINIIFISCFAPDHQKLTKKFSDTKYSLTYRKNKNTEMTFNIVTAMFLMSEFKTYNQPTIIKLEPKK